MKKTALLLVLSLCGFQDGNPDIKGLNQDALTGWKPEWDYKVGTWVKFKHSFAGEEQEKQAVLKSRKDNIANVETSYVGNPVMPVTKSSHYLAVPSHLRGPTTTRTAKLKVGEKEVDCTIYTIKMPVHGPTLPHTVQVWKTNDIALKDHWWCMRYELKIASKRRIDLDLTEEILKVGEEIPLKANGKEIKVKCIVVKITRKLSSEDSQEWKEWRSMEIPGRIVKKETPIPYTDPPEYEVLTATEFEVKK